MSWSGAVEVHQLVLELLASGLGYQVGQGQVVNLLLAHQVKLGTFGTSEITLEYSETEINTQCSIFVLNACHLVFIIFGQ